MQKESEKRLRNEKSLLCACSIHTAFTFVHYAHKEKTLMRHTRELHASVY